nr:kirola-like [Tanacetum cinerariifolium]
MMMHVEIDSSGDVLYDIVRYRPNDLATILPDKVQGCYLLDGQWGAVGSIICWNFTYDGKSEVIKQEIEEVNDSNHKIVFNVLEAKLVEGIYKSFKIIFYTEPDDNGKLAAVTFEFEKENSKMPYPTDFMDYLCDIFRGVDKYNSSI